MGGVGVDVGERVGRWVDEWMNVSVREFCCA